MTTYSDIPGEAGVDETLRVRLHCAVTLCGYFVRLHCAVTLCGAGETGMRWAHALVIGLLLVGCGHDNDFSW